MAQQSTAARSAPAFNVDVPDDFQCGVCCEVIVPFMTLGCGHAVCGACFPKLTHCPSCRKSIVGGSAVRTFQAEAAALASVRYRCRTAGCDWVGDVAGSKRHLCRAQAYVRYRALAPPARLTADAFRRIVDEAMDRHEALTASGNSEAGESVDDAVSTALLAAMSQPPPAAAAPLRSTATLQPPRAAAAAPVGIERGKRLCGVITSISLRGGHGFIQVDGRGSPSAFFSIGSIAARSGVAITDALRGERVECDVYPSTKKAGAYECRNVALVPRAADAAAPTPAASTMMRGTITEVVPSAEGPTHGFIQVRDGPSVYFHMSAVEPGTSVQVGASVALRIVPSPFKRGKVQAADVTTCV